MMLKVSKAFLFSLGTLFGALMATLITVLQTGDYRSALITLIITVAICGVVLFILLGLGLQFRPAPEDLVSIEEVKMMEATNPDEKKKEPD